MALMGLAMDISKTDKDGKPNAKDWAEFKRRVLIWEALDSPLFLDQDGDSKTLDVFKNHWGITTNVSTLTGQQWDKKTREAYDMEQSWYPKG